MSYFAFANLELGLLIFPLSIIIALVLSTFLFWRAGRHEFFDSEVLFDTILVSIFGALIFGRIFDFLVRANLYQWSFGRLAFFNAYGGLDFYGALFGLIFSAAIFLKRRKIIFWSLLDLAAAPLALGISIFFFGIAEMYLSIAYLAIFFIIKRLETKKRHTGFFACFFLVYVALVSFVSASFKHELVFLGSIAYDLVASFALLLFACLSWYILAKREPRGDFKGFLAFLLLVFFGIKRALTSVHEADKIARSVVLSPFYIAKLFYFFVKIVWSEFIRGVLDFVKAWGLKR